MRTKVDLLPVSLHELRVSAFHRVWIKLGMGIQVRARTTASGYDLRIRYGKDDTIKKSSVKVEYGARWANGNPRPTLSCASCGKLAFQNLYLDTKTWQWKCSPCLGVKPWKVRVPMKWDLGEETKFRQLLRRKVDEDILKFELAALRGLSAEAFLATRPYLVPPWVEQVREFNPKLYAKLLKTLHGKYRAVMMRRRIQFLNDKENKWLMEKLGVVFEKAFIISRRDIAWLQQHHQQQTSGSQPGLKSELLSSQPLEIGCSLAKTSSGQATNVELAQVLEQSAVQIAGELEVTAENEEMK
jgi:hypothetical protein